MKPTKRRIRRKPKITQPKPKSKPEKSDLSTDMDEREKAALEALKQVKLDPLFNLTPTERIKALDAQYKKDPRTRISSAMNLIDKLYHTKTFPEVKALLKFQGLHLSCFERSMINMINDSQNQKSKTSGASTNTLLERLHGKATARQEISGPNGQPLTFNAETSKVKIDISKLSREELKEYKKLLSLRNKATVKPNES